MELSEFGKRFSRDAGILSLMDDLGNALASDEDMIMMGGGNPGHIPEFQAIIRKQVQAIIDDDDLFRRMIGIYDPPQGELEFISHLAALFRKEYGWNISEKNIALTNGSQPAFFSLFNMFAGRFDDGSEKKIRLPLTPEYIGYADVGLTDGFFISSRPEIEFIDRKLFKYHVDFSRIDICGKTGALCVSRPTNPTGNVLTDEEISRLDAISRENGIPLIIDNAYGAPFPGIIYKDINPFWNDNIIMCMSLSKLGLPAARTGIVVAREEYIRVLTGVNAIMTLAPNSIGSMFAMNLVKTREILDLSRNVIRPFYESRKDRAVAWFREYFDECDCLLHTPEGAMFIWLWFRDLPISSLELYERLKKRGVLVVSGHYFFPGLEDGWKHASECLRLTYSQDEEGVRRGLEIIADEAKKAYKGK